MKGKEIGKVKNEREAERRGITGVTDEMEEKIEKREEENELQT